MTLASQITSDVTTVFLGSNNEFEETVTYTAYGESAASITAIVIRSDDSSITTDDLGERRKKTCEAWVSTDDVTSINEGHRFTIDTVTYAIDTEQESKQESGMRQLFLKSIDRVSYGSQGFARKG